MKPWSAASEADYIAKAVVLVADKALKTRVAEAVHTSTLFDPTTFARSLEAAYETLVRR